MPEIDPILEPSYWKERVDNAQWAHSALYHCTPDDWARVREGHIAVIKEHIEKYDTVLDAGCGPGRLLELLPQGYQRSGYVGVDLYEPFIKQARMDFHEDRHRFIVGDLQNPFLYKQFSEPFDWSVLVFMRGMFINHLGQEQWELIRCNLLHASDKLLLLNYYEEGAEVNYEIIVHDPRL